MVTISVERNHKEDFSVFEVAEHVISRMKDVGTVGKNIDLDLHGFTHEQSKAVINVLCYSYMGSLGPTPVQSIQDRDHRDMATYVIQGIGEMKVNIPDNGNAATVSFPAYDTGTLPAYKMSLVKDSIKKSLTRFAMVYNVENRGDYYVLPYHHKAVRDGLLSVFTNIINAHVPPDDNNLGSSDDGLLNEKEEPVPAILIKRDILEEVCAKEKLPLGKTR